MVLVTHYIILAFLLVFFLSSLLPLQSFILLPCEEHTPQLSVCFGGSVHFALFLVLLFCVVGKRHLHVTHRLCSLILAILKMATFYLTVIT